MVEPLKEPPPNEPPKEKCWVCDMRGEEYVMTGVGKNRKEQDADLKSKSDAHLEWHQQGN